MATVVLGCDTNASNDSQFQDTVAKALRSAGHSVEKLPIGPNDFASYSYALGGKNPKGKIGVFLIADGLTAIGDLAYGNTSFKYAYFGVRGDLGRPKMDSYEDFKNNPIGADWHGDCDFPGCTKLIGKTYPEINKMVKNKCQVIFGRNAEEMGKNLVKAISGEGLTDDTGESLEGGDQEPSATTIKEALQRLLKHWDGEVECYVRDDKVYVHKVRDPTTYTSLLLEEGVNVLSGTVSITDINPNTTNHLIVTWTEGTIEFKDNDLIKRFGEKDETVEAVRKVITKSEEYEEARSDSETALAEERGDAIATFEEDTEDTETTEDTEDTEEEEETETKKKTKIEEIPIDNYEEALEFSHLYWNKIRRDDGHSIDCQVMGDSHWKVGEWCRVKLPSFNEDCYMYITRASHSGDGDWVCSLTLKDYPPGWGVETEEDVTTE